MIKPPPSADISFIENLLAKHPKIQAIEKIGNTTFYIISGSKPIGQRMIPIRSSDDGQVDFEFITALGINFKCLEEITKWLEENRNWKDGGYFV